MKRRLVWASTLGSPSMALAASEGADSHAVITHIAMCMVAASVLGVVLRYFKQPLLLAYVGAGVLIGPLGLEWITDQEAIATVAEIGLILLLFMIGLEIDLRTMLAAGRLVVVTGVLQFPVSLLVGWGIFTLLGMLGFGIASGPYAALYAGIAISLSSTMIVVKLLYEKLELDTLAGRITVGILVFQDLWAIVVLAVQPNLANPELVGLARTFGAGLVLVLAALAASRYVLPRVFRPIAKVPELMLVVSLGWCFLVGLVAAHPRVGLSMEMGALIAGVAMATFPYNLDVIARVLSIRDFFITLFFVALGMQIPLPGGAVLLSAAVIGSVLVISRVVGVFGILHVLRAGHWASLLPTINLAQMSEFALVILAIGVKLGHVGQDVLTAVIWAFAVLAVASTYQIQASHKLERWLSRWLNRAGLRDLRPTISEVTKAKDRPVVILGYYRIAAAFTDAVLRREQHLTEDLKVVDFNPEVRDRLRALGIPCVYGDIANTETLHHAGVEHARVVLCTVPDGALRGTSNAKLLTTLQHLCPEAAIIVTADTPEHARALYDAGADYVLEPAALSGDKLLTAVQQALSGTTEGLREEATGKYEVLSG